MYPHSLQFWRVLFLFLFLTYIVCHVIIILLIWKFFIRAFNSPGRILGCVYTICSYGEISISCTIPNGSPFPPNRVKSYTPVLVCWNRLLRDWWFFLCHHITYICCCVLSILILIWLVLMALFSAAIRRDSVSLLIFPFSSHVPIFLWETSLVSCLKHP